MDIVEQVLNREVNPELAAILNEFGCKARGIHGEDIITVRKHVAADPDTGETLDWGLVGEITGVDVLPVKAYLEADITPVITPLGADEARQIYNINADAAAAALAERLQARKLVFLSDVPGLLSDPSRPQLAHEHPAPLRGRGPHRARSHRRRHAAQDQRRPQGPQGRRPQDPHHRRGPAAFPPPRTVHRPGRRHGDRQ
jgi:hypothetical protein